MFAKQHEMPSHMMAEYNASIIYRAANTVIGISIVLIWGAFTPFISYAFDSGFSYNTFIQFNNYITYLNQKPLQIHEYYLTGRQSIPKLTAMYTYLIGIIPAGIISLIIAYVNPYRSSLMTKGSARFASKRDIIKMNREKQFGTKGKYLHFGYFEKEKLSLIETISVLMLAPPGTGKTAGFIVPGLVTTDNSCFIVNDPKPEIFDICSGYRASIGPSFKLEWSAIDDPEAGIFYPKFNFLDPEIVPKRLEERDTFIDALAKILVPEAEGGKSDPYFVNQGRSAITGFLHFIVAKINDRTDPERYDMIPKEWHGMDASIPMMVAWLTQAQMEAVERANESKGQMAMPVDPMSEFCQACVDEAKNYRYPTRALMELQPLVTMADKERSGVIGTMNEGLLPFKNKSVAQRTSGCDFTPADLRGILKEGIEMPKSKEEWEIINDNDFEPTTVFICVNQAEADAFTNITALFFEVCSKTLLAHGPGEYTRQGRKLGPYPTCFLMDEFAKLPKIPAVLEGPDLGRSKKTYYYLAAQDYGQIGKKYSKEDQGVINGTTGVKVILPQNNPDSIKLISEMVGETTITRSSISRNVGFSKNAQVFGGNKSETVEGTKLLNNSNLATMPKGKHLLIVQKFMDIPIWADTPFFFKDKSIVKKIYNPRNKKGIKPAPPMPKRFMLKHKLKKSKSTEQLVAITVKFRKRFSVPIETLALTPSTAP